MKNRRFLVFGSNVVLVLLLLSCPLAFAQQTPSPAPASASNPAVTGPSGDLAKIFIIGMGVTGAGKVGVLSTSWSAILDKYSGMKSSIEDVPTSQMKADFIRNGTIQSFMFSPDVALDAYLGRRGVAQTRLRNLTSAGNPAASVGGFFTRPDSGIKTVKGLKGKKVFADYAPSPWMAVMAETALKANGLTRSDVTWLKFTNSTDAYREVKEKRVDAILFVMGTGTQDMAGTVGVYCIPFSPAEQAEIEKALPSFQPIVVLKGQEGANADTPLMASNICCWVGAQLSEKTAYTAVKTLYDHIDEHTATYPAASGFSLKNALNVWLIPYHPGAITFFKEKGIWTAEAEKQQQALLDAEKALFK